MCFRHRYRHLCVQIHGDYTAGRTRGLVLLSTLARGGSVVFAYTEITPLSRNRSKQNHQIDSIQTIIDRISHKVRARTRSFYTICLIIDTALGASVDCKITNACNGVELNI